MNELLTKGIGHTEFKDSPVGKIPVEWEVKELVQVGRCIRGLTYSPDNVVENGLLVLRSSNVQDGRLLFEDNVYVDLKVGDEYLSKNGDILICVRNGSRRLLGKSATITSNCPKSTHGAFMTVFRGELNFYVKHLMKSEMFFRQVSIDIGATINSINNSNLLQFRFAFPPLPEQQKIASILTSVDEVIEKTQSQINKLQDMKKGTMNELLTKGIGHTEFKDSPVGKIPKEWEVKKFGEIARVQGGYAFKSKDAQESGARWLKIANVGIGKVVWKDKSHLPPEFLTEHRDFVLRTGDIIVALTRPILNHKLKIAMVDTPDSGALLNQRVGRILSKTDVGVRFLYYLLKSEYSVGFIEKVIFGSDPPNISGQQIESINFAIPSIQEQQKIASILSSMDSHIEEKQRKLQQTQSLKKSLMQDLLTGKVRVTVN